MTPPVERQLDGKETPIAPATSLARLRKLVLDLVARGRLSMVEAWRHLGISVPQTFIRGTSRPNRRAEQGSRV